MNPIKKISVSLTAQLNHFIESIENHEAIAESVIREMSDSLVKARVQIQRVKRDRQRLEKELTEHEKLTAFCEKKVKGSADDDQALIYVKRYDQAAQRLKNLRNELKEHQKMEKDLRSKHLLLQSKIDELKRKKNILACKQVYLHTRDQQHKEDILQNATEQLEKWEYQLDANLDEGGSEPVVDEVQEEFLREEEKERLEGLLKQMKEGGEHE